MSQSATQHLRLPHDANWVEHTDTTSKIETAKSTGGPEQHQERMLRSYRESASQLINDMQSSGKCWRMSFASRDTGSCATAGKGGEDRECWHHADAASRASQHNQRVTFCPAHADRSRAYIAKRHAARRLIIEALSKRVVRQVVSFDGRFCAKLLVVRTFSANGVSDGVSVPTRGPIGRSSSMQEGSEKTRIGRRGSRRPAADKTVNAYIASEYGAAGSTTCCQAGQQNAEALYHCIDPGRDIRYRTEDVLLAIKVQSSCMHLCAVGSCLWLAMMARKLE